VRGRTGVDNPSTDPLRRLLSRKVRHMKHSQTAGPLLKAALVIILLLGLCPLTPAQSNEGSKPAACEDNTPHKVQFITVSPGVQLEVLDWGGSREAMVLLTGLGDNAHVFDEFAFQFTPYFHVIGITRRGFLPSSQPKDGYDVGTRAADDIAVLNALKIDRAVFVGHSLAGSELSRIGEAYKDRVDKLVYLDAADLAERFLPSRAEPPGDGSLFTSEANRSLWDFQAATARIDALREPAPAVCIGLQFDANGAITGSTTPAWVSTKLLDGVAGSVNPPVNWGNVDAPRLGIFALFTLAARQSYYWYLRAADKKLFDEAWPPIVAWHRATIDKFAASNPVHPLLLPGAPHYVYIDNEAEVVREMRKFLGIPVGGN
jgi:non-heme chloroperoxidase